MVLTHQSKALAENFTDTLSVDITGDDVDESHAIQTEVC